MPLACESEARQGAALLHYAPLQRRPNEPLIAAMAREPNAPSDKAKMLARTTLKRPERPERPDQDEPARAKGQTRPIEERFLLRVDGQMKRSFSDKELAVIAGAKIKKAYPLVVVTVVDTEKHTTEIINA